MSVYRTIGPTLVMRVMPLCNSFSQMFVFVCGRSKPVEYSPVPGSGNNHFKAVLNTLRFLGTERLKEE